MQFYDFAMNVYETSIVQLVQNGTLDEVSVRVPDRIGVSVPL